MTGLSSLTIPLFDYIEVDYTDVHSPSAILIKCCIPTENVGSPWFWNRTSAIQYLSWVGHA